MNSTNGNTAAYLRGHDPRGRFMRLDSASILKRFFLCEAATIRGQAGWIPALAPLEIKLTLPRHMWEDAELADALRNRVFELKFPRRFIELDVDAPLIAVFEAARHAPSGVAYLHGLANVLVPALAQAYMAYLAAADTIGDGPTKRFLELGVREKETQISELRTMVDTLMSAADDEACAATLAWTDGLAAALAAVGGVALDPPTPVGTAPTLPGSRTFRLADRPARDPNFRRTRFYWPDNFDATYDYGSGIRLQLRSAISHLNEVWAVETAAAILEAFADTLGWEFVSTAARWAYDESRHTKMGWQRLRDWGFRDEELPVGTYIYDSGSGEDPLYRLAMLSYFETKNIGKKLKRAAEFASYGDTVSEHDMDFDWADEGMHTEFGRRWLTALFSLRKMPMATAMAEMRNRCDALVKETVARATPQEIAETNDATERLIEHAHRLVAASVGVPVSAVP